MHNPDEKKAPGNSLRGFLFIIFHNDTMPASASAKSEGAALDTAGTA